ncbi:hypothetical protein BGZ94_006074 [Podila epigama]|nr:hypothetical protein BGZ94_006074 [Podila epigama]
MVILQVAHALTLPPNTIKIDQRLDNSPQQASPGSTWYSMDDYTASRWTTMSPQNRQLAKRMEPQPHTADDSKGNTSSVEPHPTIAQSTRVQKGQLPPPTPSPTIGNRHGTSASKSTRQAKEAIHPSPEMKPSVGAPRPIALKTKPTAIVHAASSSSTSDENNINNNNNYDNANQISSSTGTIPGKKSSPDAKPIVLAIVGILGGLASCFFCLLGLSRIGCFVFQRRYFPGRKRYASVVFEPVSVGGKRIGLPKLVVDDYDDPMLGGTMTTKDAAHSSSPLPPPSSPPCKSMNHDNENSASGAKTVVATGTSQHGEGPAATFSEFWNVHAEFNPTLPGLSKGDNSTKQQTKVHTVNTKTVTNTATDATNTTKKKKKSFTTWPKLTAIHITSPTEPLPRNEPPSPTIYYYNPEAMTTSTSSSAAASSSSSSSSSSS